MAAAVVALTAAIVITGQNDWPNNLAALPFFDGHNAACLDALNATYPGLTPGAVAMERVDLDDDGADDYIVEFTAEKYCGSGGCLYELCNSNEGGGVEHVPFGFAAHSLTVQHTLTGGMRDIMVNDNGSLLLQWNGTKYELMH